MLVHWFTSFPYRIDYDPGAASLPQILVLNEACSVWWSTEKNDILIALATQYNVSHHGCNVRKRERSAMSAIFFRKSDPENLNVLPRE